MLFNSYAFILLFLPLTLGIFYFFEKIKRHSLALFSLVLASFIFYSWLALSFLFLMLTSLIINYYIAIKLKSSQFKAKNWVILGVLFNLSLIIFYKYTNFLIDTTNFIFNQHISHFNIILPLAISFFTFQQIAFLVDLYHHKAEVPSLLKYFLFVTFFPQLIAGPIVHHQEIIPQFENKKLFTINAKNVSIGLSIFCIGLFKKVGIADYIAPLANQVFYFTKIGEMPTFWEAWSGAFLYAFQLYFDFSGYSDMAVGLAKLFGITLPINFNSPYQAANIIDFWRRWHITLSRFLRDYLYIPLGGNQRGRLFQFRNLMITMLLGGLWHGAGINFMLWGGLHGVYLIVNHLWQHLLSRFNMLPQKSLIYQWSCRLITFIAVVWAWVLFRAEDLFSAKRMYQAMLGLQGIPLPIRFISWENNHIIKKLNAFISFDGMFHHQLFKCNVVCIALAVLLFISFLFPNTFSIMKKYLPVHFRVNQAQSLHLYWQPTIFWALALSVLGIICLSLLSQPSEFLYYQF